MNMTNVELDMIQTAGIGAFALIVGMTLTRKVAFLQKFCVPSPVSGGIIFSLLTLALYGWFDVAVSFDGTLKDTFMLAFFTMVGASELVRYLIPLVSASLMTTPLIINHLQISKTLIGNGLETSCLRRSALFQYVKYLMQR